MLKITIEGEAKEIAALFAAGRQESNIETIAEELRNLVRKADYSFLDHTPESQ